MRTGRNLRDHLIQFTPFNTHTYTYYHVGNCGPIYKQVNGPKHLGPILCLQTSTLAFILLHVKFLIDLV